VKNGNKIFKKGKSDVLTFKNREATQDPLAAIPTADLANQKLAKVAKIKKQYIGVEPILSKPSIGQFYRRKEINVGDTIMIKGMTTGEQQWSLPRCK
jgi:UPF0176 protein